MRLLLMVRAFQVMGHYAGAHILARFAHVCCCISCCCHALLARCLQPRSRCRGLRGGRRASAAREPRRARCCAACCCATCRHPAAASRPLGAASSPSPAFSSPQPSWTRWAWMRGLRLRSWIQPTTGSARRTWTGSERRGGFEGRPRGAALPAAAAAPGCNVAKLPRLPCCMLPRLPAAAALAALLRGRPGCPLRRAAACRRRLLASQTVETNHLINRPPAAGSTWAPGTWRGSWRRGARRAVFYMLPPICPAPPALLSALLYGFQQPAMPHACRSCPPAAAPRTRSSSRLPPAAQVRTLREILERLRETYCGTIGYEVRCVRCACGNPVAPCCRSFPHRPQAQFALLAAAPALSDPPHADRSPLPKTLSCSPFPLPRPPNPPQYMHIPDSEKCNWLRARIETAERQEYSQEEKLRILDRCGGPVKLRLAFVGRCGGVEGWACGREEKLRILGRCGVGCRLVLGLLGSREDRLRTLDGVWGSDRTPPALQPPLRCPFQGSLGRGELTARTRCPCDCLQADVERDV